MFSGSSGREFKKTQSMESTSTLNSSNTVAVFQSSSNSMSKYSEMKPQHMCVQCKTSQKHTETQLRLVKKVQQLFTLTFQNPGDASINLKYRPAILDKICHR
ncbi:unnamed protein product [Arctogadus glacialis]